MLARKIILGFGFAAVLPLLVHYGILVLLVAFGVLLWIGYQRLHELTGALHAA